MEIRNTENSVHNLSSDCALVGAIRPRDELHTRGVRDQVQEERNRLGARRQDLREVEESCWTQRVEGV